MDKRMRTGLNILEAALPLGVLPSLPRDARCALASDLLTRWTPHTPADWRTRNVARSCARDTVHTQRAALNAEANCPVPAEAAGHVLATAAATIVTYNPPRTSDPAIGAGAVLPTPAARTQSANRAMAVGRRARVSDEKAKRQHGEGGAANERRR